jgi:hypothetical protein
MGRELPNWRLRSKGGTKLKETRRPRADDASPIPSPETQSCSVGKEVNMKMVIN